MSSLFISGPMQAVEDRRKLEKHSGSKKLSGYSLGCPIPNLRRRTSVANHNTWTSNVDSGLYYGTNDRRVHGNKHELKPSTNTTSGANVYPCGSH